METALRRLLLALSEQTCFMVAVEKRLRVPLAQVQTQTETEDKSYAFVPHLLCTKSNKSFVDSHVSLSLSTIGLQTAGPFMVHCQLFWEYNRNTAEKTAPIAEAYVLLQAEQKVEDVLKVPYESWNITHKSKMTIIMKIYDNTPSPDRPPSGLGLSLNKARLAGDLCDVQLVVAGVELSAHRTVLAARSPVLHKMLTGDFKEAHEGRVELVLEGTSPAASRAAIEKFVEYLYTDRILDWGGSELDLLKLADMYMVPELRADCELELWGCDATRALAVLHVAGLGEHVIRSKVRRRLTATVMENMNALADTVEWTEFKTAYPILVDTMLSCEPKPSANGCFIDWSL